jgi:hypothetical protein
MYIHNFRLQIYCFKIVLRRDPELTAPPTNPDIKSGKLFLKIMQNEAIL